MRSYRSSKISKISDFLRGRVELICPRWAAPAALGCPHPPIAHAARACAPPVGWPTTDGATRLDSRVLGLLWECQLFS
jgi:hypothetical protein